MNCTSARPDLTVAPAVQPVRFDSGGRKGATRPPHSLALRKRDEDGPQLGAARRPGERQAQRSQVAADRFQLAHERARTVLVKLAAGSLQQLAEALEGGAPPFGELGRRGPS